MNKETWTKEQTSTPAFKELNYHDRIVVVPVEVVLLLVQLCQTVEDLKE